MMRIMAEQPEKPERPATIPPMLRGELVWLRASERADFMDDPPPVNDPEIGHMMGLKMPVGIDGAADFAQMVLSQQDKTLWSFAICRLGDTRAIGNVSLRNIDRENGSAEMSVLMTDHAYIGRGYGTDAVNCIVDFGFGELRLQRIYLRVFDYNPRAKRSYQKSGFQTDATLRHARFHRGQHHDVDVMSILRDEWLALDRPRAWDPR
jgi:RimJ/RimL family protein N-acetyltransferase